jgi:hypothetical protein
VPAQESKLILTPLTAAGKGDKSLLIDALPVWERTALNVQDECIIRIADRVGAEVGEVSLHYRLVFLWRPIHTVVGGLFGKAGAREMPSKAAVICKDQDAFRSATIRFRLAAIRALSHQGDEGPSAYQSLFAQLLRLLGDGVIPARREAHMPNN